MIIKVEKSKTDQLRQRDEVVIAQSGVGFAQFPYFKLAYLRKLDIDPNSSEFIFRPLVKTKSSYKLVQKDKPISYATFRDLLAKSLQNIIPDPSVYGTHSFRSGGASKATKSGVSDRVFQRYGRWKSVAAKDGILVFPSHSSSPILFLLGRYVTFCYSSRCSAETTKRNLMVLFTLFSV